MTLIRLTNLLPYRTIQIAKFLSTQASSDNSYTLDDFILKYPLLIKSQAYRDSALERNIMSETSWLARSIKVPIRKLLMNLAAKQFINLRFSDNETTLPNELKLPYIPDQFLNGAEIACQALFNHLESPTNEFPTELKNIMTENLYKRFQENHDSFKELGLDLKIKLNSLQNPEINDFWFIFFNGRIIFGGKYRGMSTLIRAPILIKYDTLSYLRMDPITKAYLYREGIFEYLNLKKVHLNSLLIRKIYESMTMET